MGLVILAAAFLAAWLYSSGRMPTLRLHHMAAFALAAVGLGMAASGRFVPALLLVGAGGLLFLQRQRRPMPPTMAVDEARSLLGVDASADAATIRAAHRRLIAQVHPDKGGTAELARRINAARDAALEALNNQPS